MKRLIKSILYLIYLKLKRWFYIPITKESRGVHKFNEMWRNSNRKQKRKIASVGTINKPQYDHSKGK